MSVKPLSDAEITEALKDLDGWERAGDTITKTYQLSSYAQGLAFATAAGMMADGQNHHPDMIIGYKKVTISFTTHDSGNSITRNDIEAARAINSIPLR